MSRALLRNGGGADSRDEQGDIFWEVRGGEDGEMLTLGGAKPFQGYQVPQSAHCHSIYLPLPGAACSLAPMSMD